MLPITYISSGAPRAWTLATLKLSKIWNLGDVKTGRNKCPTGQLDSIESEKWTENWKINCKSKVTMQSHSFIHFISSFYWHCSVLPFRKFLLRQSIPESKAVNESLSWCHDFLAFIRPSASKLGHLANCLASQVKKTSKMDKLSLSTMSRIFKMWKRRSTICAASICLTQPWRCCTIFAKIILFWWEL